MNQQIRNRWTDEVMFEGDFPDVRSLVKEALNALKNDLRGAYLRGAYLRGADLQDADLRGADLQDAYLRGADLQDADLQGADLRGAYLRGADLQGADLQRAHLRGADLGGAVGLDWTVIQIQGSRHWITTLPDGNVAVGCIVHTSEEWLANYEQIGRDNNYSEKQIREYGEYLKTIDRILKDGEP